MKRLFIAALLIAILLINGCAISFQNEFNDLDTQTIEHEAGYRLLLPADWTLAETDEQGDLYYSADSLLSLSLMRELGGVEYYSLQEIGNMLSADISGELFSAVKPGVGKVKDRMYSQTIDGEDEDGNPLVCELRIFAPYVGIRYYLVFIASGEDYQQNRNVINGIIGSFTVTKSEEETFQWMQQQRDAAHAAAGAEAGAAETGESSE